MGNVALSSVTYFVFDKDPNVPNSYRTFTKFVLPCGGGSTCRTDRADYLVSHTQVAKIVTYFEDNLGRSTNGELTMPYNEKGVLYPIVYSFGYGGVTSQQVPWPPPRFFPCSKKLPANSACTSPSAGFRDAIISMYADEHWPLTLNTDGRVPNDWEAHHIKPRSWGGSNNPDNGVLLFKKDHVLFTNWWNEFVQDGVRVPVRTGSND